MGRSLKTTAAPATTTTTGAPDKRTRTSRQRDHKQYDQALVDRGNVSMYIAPDVLDQWKRPAQPGQAGPRGYTDTTIRTCLTLGAVFNLRFRQTQGFITWLLNQCGRPDLTAPDHTTLSIRRRELHIDLLDAASRTALLRATTGGFDLVIDGSGVSIHGPGAWRMNKWGTTDVLSKRWYKVLVVSEPTTGIITGIEVDTDACGELTATIPVLEQSYRNTGAHPNKLVGDGAFDCAWLARHVATHGTTLVAPPDVNAVVHTTGYKHRAGSQHVPGVDTKGFEHRNQRIRSRMRTGSDTEWKLTENYHQRSNAETVFSRHQAVFGEQLHARVHESRVVETRLRYALLNTWRAHEIQLGGGYTSFQAR